MTARAGQPRWPRRSPIARALVALALAADVAHANVIATYGLDARTAALAGAVTADALGPAAAFHNPALLHLRPGLDVVLGTTFQALALDANGTRGRGADDVFIVHGGLSVPVPLGGPLAERVHFGLAFALPTEEARLTRIFLPPADDPFFVPFSSATERVSIVPALGVRVVDGVHVGGAVDFFPFDSPNQQVGRVQRSGAFALNGDLKLLADFIPRVGLAVEGGVLHPALAGLRFGALYAESFDDEFELPAVLDVGFPIDLRIEGKSLFVPRRASLGAAYDPRPDVTVTTALVWQGWSDLPSPRLRIRVLGLDDLLPLEALAEVERVPVPPRLDDTLSPRVGVEWRATDALTLRLGYAYEPSLGVPVDDPYLLTNARHVVGSGIAFDHLERLVGAEEGPEIDLALFFQAHVLETLHRRLEVREPADPAELEAGGFVGVLGFSLEVAAP